MTHYNQLPEVDENKPCVHFELSVNISESASKVTVETQSNIKSVQTGQFLVFVKPTLAVPACWQNNRMQVFGTMALVSFLKSYSQRFSLDQTDHLEIRENPVDLLTINNDIVSALVKGAK